MCLANQGNSLQGMSVGFGVLSVRKQFSGGPGETISFGLTGERLAGRGIKDLSGPVLPWFKHQMKVVDSILTHGSQSIARTSECRRIPLAARFPVSQAWLQLPKMGHYEVVNGFQGSSRPHCDCRLSSACGPVPDGRGSAGCRKLSKNDRCRRVTIDWEVQSIRNEA